MADQIAAGADLPYGKFLSWRGMVDPEPPRRPEPQRVSSSAAWRNEEWKFGFVGSQRPHQRGRPPAALAGLDEGRGASTTWSRSTVADAEATIATYTVDRLAYSPSPPIVFAVLDFDGGGRFPVELTDVDPDAVAIGDRVEMTFRRLYTADGIHDYFWKAKPVRAGGAATRAEHGRRHDGREEQRWHRMGSRTGWRSSGMGCTRFAEHWDKGLDDLIIEASEETFASAGVTKDDVDAYWFGTAQSGMSGITLARPLQLRGQAGHPGRELLHDRAPRRCGPPPTPWPPAPTTWPWRSARRRSRTPATRASTPSPSPSDGTARTLTAAAMFSMVAPAYGKKYGVGEDELTEVLARISWKNHQNGARNPRAQFRKEVSTETICASPRVAGRLGVFDCAGVADGAAAAIVVRAEDAHRYTDKPLYIKALSFAAGSGSGLIDPDYDYTWFPECAPAAEDAYRQAGITDPRHAAGHGRGARLLHADRAGPDGGPRLRRAGHGVEGGAGRHLRPRRRAARSTPTAG